METKLIQNSFQDPDSCRTLALEVENEKFWIPRDTLANYSPVFKAMLYGDFNESNLESIPLPKKKAHDIHELLLCLIPTPHLKNIDESNLELLLEFSDEYQIDDLRRRAENFLKSKLSSTGKNKEKLFYVLKIDSDWRMRSLLHDCIKKCVKEFSICEMQSIFCDLRSEVVASLMIYAGTMADGKCRFVAMGEPGGPKCYKHRRTPNMMCVNCGVFRCGACLNDGFEKGICSGIGEKKTEENVKELLQRM